MPDNPVAGQYSDIPRVNKQNLESAMSGIAGLAGGGLAINAGDPGLDTNASGTLAIGATNATAVNIDPPTTFDGATTVLGLATLSADILANTGSRIRSLQTVAPTVGSGGSGISLLSVVAGSTNMAGQVNATLTAVAAGVVIGVVVFNGAPLATAPIAVVCCLAGPTAGDAAPPDVGADTYTTSGFTLRSYGPTTVTTAAYVITYICIFA